MLREHLAVANSNAPSAMEAVGVSPGGRLLYGPAPGALRLTMVNGIMYQAAFRWTGTAWIHTLEPYIVTPLSQRNSVVGEHGAVNAQRRS